MTRIGAILLAAGMSTRMGEPKLLLPLDNRPLFLFCLDPIIDSGLHPIKIVAGHYRNDIYRETKHIAHIDVLYNENYKLGMSTSIKCGLEAVKDHVDAVFIFLADQPLLSKQVIQEMVNTYLEKKNDGILIVRPKYAHELGHPILIDSVLFEDFLSLEGDQGGKDILKKNSDKMIILSFDNLFWGKDVDTLHDYLQIQEYANQSRGPLYP